MPRKCHVCNHKQKKAIDDAIFNNEVYRKIAEKFKLTYTQVYYHGVNHVKPLIQQAQKKVEIGIVSKIAKTRDEVNLSALNKTRLMQHKLLEELDQIPKHGLMLDERLAVIKEFRGWFIEENRIAGNYTQDKNNPDSITPEQVAREVVQGLIKKGVTETQIRQFAKEDGDDHIIEALERGDN